MRKVFLDHLPKINGYDGKKIDWIESVGKFVDFIYEDISGSIEIVKYKKGSILEIKYKNDTMYIGAAEFRKCKIGYLLKKITKEHKIDINQTFKDEKRDLIIFDRKYKQRCANPNRQGENNTINEKVYKYKCNKCGFDCGEHYKGGKYFKECWIAESSILNGCGCSCCSGLATVLGINTIWDTDREMCLLGISEEDAKLYSKGTREEIIVKCPHCGRMKKKSVNKIYTNKSIGCSCSGEGSSYPERFMFNLLNQLGIKFVTQLSKKVFNWCGDKRYDFYIPEYNMIIETHGGQHYEEAKGFYKSLKKEQDIDRLKENLARENGIKNYVVVDCRYSDSVWIKERILETYIAKIFDLSEVDWVEISVKSMTSNIVRQVCDYWNQKEDWETTKDLSNHFSINRGVVTSYLKKGATNLGWCKYDPYEEMLKSTRGKSGWNKKRVEVFKDETSLGIFESALQIERQSEQKFGVKMLHTSISQVCSGKRNHHKGFRFQFVD